MKTTLMTFFIYSKHKPQQQELLKLHIAQTSWKDQNKQENHRPSKKQK